MLKTCTKSENTVNPNKGFVPQMQLFSFYFSPRASNFQFHCYIAEGLKGKLDTRDDEIRHTKRKIKSENICNSKLHASAWELDFFTFICFLEFLLWREKFLKRCMVYMEKLLVQIYFNNKLTRIMVSMVSTVWWLEKSWIRDRPNITRSREDKNIRNRSSQTKVPSYTHTH